jgi:hypothetical protein
MLLALLAPGAAHGVTPEAMRGEIEGRFRLTIVDRLGFLKESGTRLIVRKEGLRVDRPGVFNRVTLVRDGQIAERGGAGIPLGGGLDGSLKPGDQLWLNAVRIDEQSVELDLSTVEKHVVTGSRGAVSLQTRVRFQYDRGLATTTAHQVLEDIEGWFGSEQAARKARTVRQGQTQEEVVSILGEPEKKILLDSKSVFIYSDLKLIFRDGRLADLE